MDYFTFLTKRGREGERESWGCHHRFRCIYLTSVRLLLGLQFRIRPLVGKSDGKRVWESFETAPAPEGAKIS